MEAAQHKSYEAEQNLCDALREFVDNYDRDQGSCQDFDDEMLAVKENYPTGGRNFKHFGSRTISAQMNIVSESVREMHLTTVPVSTMPQKGSELDQQHFGKILQQTCQNFFCKTDSLSATLVFETRTKYQDFVARYKDDGIPTKLTVHFATSQLVSRSVSPNHVKNGKSENILRLCGKFSTDNSKFSSLKKMAHSLSLRLTPVHKFLASRIEETAWKPSVQTCSIWKRTGVCSQCS